MELRQLRLTDADRMLEWLQDPSINCFFSWSDLTFTLEKTKSFIEKSWIAKNEIHLAVSDNENYMGTVSLKKIDLSNRNAEYAISLHPDAIGQNYASFATTEILKKAFGEIGLERVYLNVLSINKRAIRFYEKYGFIYEGEFKKHIIKNGTAYDLRWYRLLADEFSILRQSDLAK